MRKNRNLLILNILYSVFAAILIIGSFLGKINRDSFFTIVFIIFVVLTLIGMWLLYATDKIKSAIVILKINNILKYLTIIGTFTIVTLLAFMVQDCAANIFKDEPVDVTFSDRLKILVITVPIVIFATIYFICTLRFLTKLKKNNLTKGISIYYASLNIFLGLALIIDLILSYTIHQSLLSSYMNYLKISSLDNNTIVVFIKVLFTLGELIYAGALLLKSYLVIDNLKNKYSRQI